MSMASASPFHIIQNQHCGIVQSIITKSYFSHFFSSAYLSVLVNHNTIFFHNEFSYSLSTPIVFESDDALHCGIASNQLDNIKNPINGYTISQIYYENDTCGNVNISFCIFKDCQSSDKFGGSIRVIEDCIVFIHGCQFESSHTKSNRGGAIYAVLRSGKSENEKNEMQINDEYLSVLNIQYCCFSKCYPEDSENLYGLSVYSAAFQTVLYYSTTSNCPPVDIIIFLVEPYLISKQQK